MTKQTFIPLFFALLGLSIAQTAKAQLSMGLRAGFLLTNVDKTPLENGEPKPEIIGGFQIAIPVELSLGDHFAIQPEIMFGTHGGKQQSSNTSTTLGITTTTSLDYKYQVGALEIPLLAKLKFGSEVFKFNVLAGPSIGWGISGRYKEAGAIRSTLSDGTVLLDQTSSKAYTAKFLQEGYDPGDIEGNEFAVVKTNLNLHFGSGICIDLGGPALCLDARYMLGLNDLRPEAEGDNKNLSYKSHRFGLSLGLLFSL